MLQNSLLRANDQSRIKCSKALVAVAQLPSGRVQTRFADGFIDEVDLLIGADGIRSIVRAHAFPSHAIAYTGRTVYRTLILTDLARTIPSLPVDAVVFWHALKGEWVYTCNLDGSVYELTVMTNEPLDENGQQRVSWEEPAVVKMMSRHFENFHKPVLDLFKLTPSVQRYATFAGPRLESIISGGNIALIGDASHPLSGAFGAGAGFALEDAYVLAQSLKWSQAFARKKPIAATLQLFDQVRSPHYESLYGVLDGFKAVGENLAAPNLELTGDEEIAVLVAMNWSKRHNWIIEYDVTQVFAEAAAQEEKKLILARSSISEKEPVNVDFVEIAVEQPLGGSL